MPLADSLPWMESADAKYDRAAELMDAFVHESQMFVETVRPTVYVKKSANAAWLVVSVPDLRPPMRLSALFGDCIHNTRCVLDHLVCGLVRRERPTHDCRETGFPICLEEADFADALVRGIKLVPIAAQKVIAKFQPWQRPDSTRRLDPLWLLNRLDNLDKHRAIAFMIGGMDRLRFCVHPTRGKAVTVVSARHAIDIGPEIIPLPLSPGALDGETRVETAGRSLLWLLRPEIDHDQEARDVLGSALSRIDEVRRALRPFFIATASS